MRSGAPIARMPSLLTIPNRRTALAAAIARQRRRFARGSRPEPPPAPNVCPGRPLRRSASKVRPDWPPRLAAPGRSTIPPDPLESTIIFLDFLITFFKQLSSIYHRDLYCQSLGVTLSGTLNTGWLTATARGIREPRSRSRAPKMRLEICHSMLCEGFFVKTLGFAGARFSAVSRLSRPGRRSDGDRAPRLRPAPQSASSDPQTSADPLASDNPLAQFALSVEPACGAGGRSPESPAIGRASSSPLTSNLTDL